MNDVVLTALVLGNKKVICDNNRVEILNVLSFDFKKKLIQTKGKYVCVIDSDDEISSNYFDVILNKIDKTDFDCCFINNSFNYKYTGDIKYLNNTDIMKYKPIINDYIWSYVYEKRRFITLIQTKTVEKFELCVNDLFKRNECITEKIYFHNVNSHNYFGISFLVSRKQSLFFDNIIYLGSYCNGLFNGYVSWIMGIGKAFSKKFKITILYDKIHEVTLKRFSEYFDCVQIDNKNNYVCKNLICTYSTFYYPRNIIYLDKSFVFIHGNMSDYKGVQRYKDDIYSEYIAVSKTAAYKAMGYFNTDRIGYIYNPYVVDKTKIKPHLSLVSTLRYAPVKRIDRIEKMAKMLDELQIPYTWNVFTDKWYLSSKGGLVFRKPVTDVLPYVKTADYLVLLSDSESFSYALIEALTVNTKVVVTPFECINDIGVEDEKNAFVIPYNYFDEGMERLLKEKLIQIYNHKNMEFEYEYDYSNFKGYEDVFYEG